MRLRDPAVILLLLLAPCPGCVVVDVGVTNPIPGLTTVAVAPFFNLSHEAAVDGRHFALAYYSELQKIPGFQVIPVGVVEQAIHDHQLELNRTEDARELARILEVDAVVIGAVTDYDPYYPPRVGLQISWYAADPWQFYPGVQVDPYARSRFRKLIDAEEHQQERYRRFQRKQEKKLENAIRRDIRDRKRAAQPDQPDWAEPKLQRVIRGQSPEVAPRVRANGEVDLASRDLDEPDTVLGRVFRPADPTDSAETISPSPPRVRAPRFSRTAQPDPVAAQPANPVRFLGGNSLKVNRPASGFSVRPVSAPESRQQPLPAPELPPKPDQKQAEITPLPSESQLYYLGSGELEVPGVFTMPLVQIDTAKPLMSYTRMFDGADADVVATLRDYVELNSDLRGGNWQAYLHRSEDFIRFTAHRMVVEMLMLHGGEGKRRLVFKLRKQR